jgi:hypothetical protein
LEIPLSRKGLPGQDCFDRPARTGKPDNEERTARKWQSGQDIQDGQKRTMWGDREEMAAWTGHPGKPEQDSQNWIARRGQHVHDS